MKVLIVGGSGLTGAQACLHLSAAGHDVTIMSRSLPKVECLQAFSHRQMDYIEDDVSVDTLKGFDWLVFAAGADIRQLPPGESEESFFTRANVEAIPRFFHRAREAGITRAVYIGTYYPQVVPERIETSAYVRSRHLADQAVRALSSDTFCVCCLNAPFILGHVPGLNVPHLQALVDYAAGRLEGLPIVAPEGAVNHITSQSMAEAVEGALLRGECGKAYLVGDETLSWKDYLELFFRAAANPQQLLVSAEEHPLFPDIIMYAGRGATIDYEPDNGTLAYGRDRVKATIAAVVEAYL